MAGYAIVRKVLESRIREDEDEDEDEYEYFKNYKEWSIQVRTYLAAQGLWDAIVEPTAEAPERQSEIWTKKDAAALHAIQISCGSYAFSLIEDITKATEAWATLESFHRKQQQYLSEQKRLRRKRELKSKDEELRRELIKKKQDEEKQRQKEEFKRERDTKKKNNYEEFQKNELFFDAVSGGDWNKSKEFIKQNKDVVKTRIPGSGKNALHVAINAGHVDIAKALIDVMTKDELELKRKDGLTALHAAVEIGSCEIARCLVNKHKELTILCSPIEKIERHANDISKYRSRSRSRSRSSSSSSSSSGETNGNSGKFTYTPVLQAVIYGQIEMAHYLYDNTSKEFLQNEEDGIQGSSLITQCICRKYFDIALDLLKCCPHLAFTKDDFNRNPLYELACTRQVLCGGCGLGFSQKLIYDCISIPSFSPRAINDHVSVDIPNLDSNKKGVATTTSVLGRLQRFALNFSIRDFKRTYEIKLAHVRYVELLKCMSQEIKKMKKKEIKDARVCDAIAKAAYNGSVEFVTEIARANPELVWTRDVAIKVFKNAIDCREAKVFSLIYGLYDRDALANSVESRTTILHTAAQLASKEAQNLIPGEALEMQRDLQWFKEVETLLPYAAEYEDDEKRKPRDLFTEEHEYLVSAGEKWMKDTSTSCTVVGALIVTIMFTVAFTVPGGNDQNTGFPLFSNKILFKIFMISDAISLFSSTTSVLMFLGILTSRYAEDDFLKSLPNKLIIGLSCLFLSIATMMITFSAALSIMFHGQVWIVVPVIFLACAPVILFVWMQFPPLRQMIMSTYGPSIFDRKAKNWLYVTSD